MLETRQDREFRQCYALHYPLVLGFLISKVGDIDDAEDICQEVFIRLNRHFGDIRDRRSWLLTAARYEISNYYNKKATAKSQAADIDGMENDPALATGESCIEERLIIRDIIDNPDNYRDEKERLLFDLVALYGYSYKEAGRYLDITRWQAEYRYRTIENRIAAMLAEKGIKKIGDLL
jgi:RNA polymerase sigma factor (sigma-70 family)